MKKRSIIICLIISLSLFLFGCDEKNDLYKMFDTKKAEKIALEYMNEKYGKDFKVVSSKKEFEAGYVPTSIQSYWCDVELALSDSETIDNYTVRVTLKDNGKDYIIEWDNYMTTLVTSLIKRDVEEIVHESLNNDYFICPYDIGEKGIGGEVGHKGFSPDFSIDPDKDTLITLLEKYDLWVCFDVNITDSVYKKSVISELKDNLKEKCFQTFSNDYIRVGIFSFDDDFYSEIQKLNESGNELPPNHKYKAIHEEVFKMT